MASVSTASAWGLAVHLLRGRAGLVSIQQIWAAMGQQLFSVSIEATLGYFKLEIYKFQLRVRGQMWELQVVVC